MPESLQNANESPSSSSLFLPLGKSARRGSRSSVNQALDRDTLQNALNSIHSAASQTSVLTTFNDFTEPPPPAPHDEPRGLAGDVQDGLTGLYNKLRATVGVSRDGQQTNRGPADHKSPTRAGLKASAEYASNPARELGEPLLASPRSLPTHGKGGEDIPLPGSNTQSKTTSTTIPALKSPPMSAQKRSVIHADPTVLEISVHATRAANGAYTEQESFKERASANSTSRTSIDIQNQPHGDDSIVLAASRPMSPHSIHSLPPLTTSSLPMAGRTIASPLEDEPSRSATMDSQDASAQDARYLHSRDNASSAFMHPTSAIDGTAVLSRKSTRVASRPTSPEGPSRAHITFPELARPFSAMELPGYQASRASSTDSLSIQGTFSPMENGLDGAREDRMTSFGPHKKTKRLLTRKMLNREFWMRDENARDCFHCGEPFSTFRRKHHCRVCGQIFDNKCTSLVAGLQFGSTQAIRVCKPCQAILAGQEDDSSDISADDTADQTRHEALTPIAERHLKSSRVEDDTSSIISQSLEQMSKTPTMSVPLRRAADSNNRSSAVLEFDGNDHYLPRPSSSRSLRTMHSLNYGHRRHNSRHQHMKNVKPYHEDRAPFQRRLTEDIKQSQKHSVFHRDSVIDPELAQYLSDDASSGDDASVQLDDSEEKLSRSFAETERTTIGGLLAAVRKGRSRIGERSIVGLLNLARDADDASIVNLRGNQPQRPGRKRNLSISSSVNQSVTPRTTKENLHLLLPTMGDSPRPVSPTPTSNNRRARMIRSASMIGLGAPAVELNRVSLEHVHKLLRQLLNDAKVHHAASWEKALVPVLLRATDDVDPDVAAGDDMDIRNYVKLKKIAGGKPSDTSYVSGLVFTKNVALKSMPRLIQDPRILIISFPVEYARYEQHFMSLDPVIRQEREYLTNLVGRIAALKPTVLLAQRNISGLALELLDKTGIATAYNVKSTVLEAVSRCTRTRIMHSIDKLATQTMQLGTCETFELRTFASEGKKKTFIYLSGCPPILGCTITLRGADVKTISVVKRITEFMIYVVYNLKLETCLMRDEWALVTTSETDPSNGASGDGLQDKLTLSIGDNLSTNSSLPTVATVGLSDVVQHKPKPQTGLDQRTSQSAKPETITRLHSGDGPEIPDDVPVPNFYEDLVEKHQTKILSASPYVKFKPPYLLMRARELERRVAYLQRLKEEDLHEEHSPEEKSKTHKFTLIQPEMVHSKLTGASDRVKEIVRAVHDAEYDKALHNHETQKRMWEAYLSGNRNLFDPYAHQNIVVLFSLVATETSVPCSGPDLLAFVYYNEHESSGEYEADCTLGQFVEDLCYRANDKCSSSACERLLHEHHRQYVHGEAQINVFVQPHPPKMRGMQNTILMWSQCRICGAETTVAPMSSSTWKYSFGKYLELSFWSADLRARASTCTHDLHRDHLRFFGYREFALRFNYDPINLLDIIVPRLRITWKVDSDLKYRNEVYSRIEQRITKFMGSVKYRLKSIKLEAILPDHADACRESIDILTKKANEEHTQLIKSLQDCYNSSKHWQTSPLNKAIRNTLERVTDWENIFADFEKKYFPSEKDIRRLATLQLHKIFLDRDVSVTSIARTEDGTSTPPAEEQFDEKQLSHVESLETSRARRMTTLSPEKAHSVLKSVVEKDAVGTVDTNETLPQSTRASQSSSQETPLGISEGSEPLAHLDLATSLSRETVASALVPGGFSEFVNAKTEDVTLPSGALLAMPAQGSQSSPALETDSTTKQKFSQDLNLSPHDALLRQASEKSSNPVSNAMSDRPGFSRAQTQPASTALLTSFSQQQLSEGTSIKPLASHDPTVVPFPTLQGDNNVKTDKKLSERLGLVPLKPGRLTRGHSMIPRAIGGKKNSRVSSLAKHFEQLSREFEKERIRERKQQAARHRQSRVYPLTAYKPIVEVYKNVHEAVQEQETSDDISINEQPDQELGLNASSTADETTSLEPLSSSAETRNAAQQKTEASDLDMDPQDASHATSEVDGDSEESETDTEADEIRLPDTPEDLFRLAQEDLEFKELQKDDRSSLMKILTNFWAERSSSGWTPLDFPIRPFDHIFADCDIIVREDEPSSIIAFTLNSQDYKSMLTEIQAQPVEPADHFDGSHDAKSLDGQSDLLNSLLRKTGTHLKYQFQEGQAKMLCKIFFAEQFAAVRKKCEVSDRIIESLSRCMKWDSKGGKTKSLFLKTLDDRFVLKSLSPIETQAFLKFAPNYFQIMSEAFFHELPSVIAKMLGFYQIVIKNPVTGVDYSWSLIVMENLFYDRTPTRIFDLKGSMRNRKIESTGEKDEVLLDENMVEFIYESPLFTRDHSKKLLKSSVHNDTLFLARQNVMDYSLMVAIDENRNELVVGIIDCIRTYTWDKKLESWIKDRGFAGGNKNRPTVTSPKEYKKRFREAMGRYVLEAPNCWHQFRPITVERKVSTLGVGVGDGKDDRQGEEKALVLA